MKHPVHQSTSSTSQNHLHIEVRCSGCGAWTTIVLQGYPLSTMWTPSRQEAIDRHGEEMRKLALKDAMGPKLGTACRCEEAEGAVVERFLDGTQAAVNLEGWVSK